MSADAGLRAWLQPRAIQVTTGLQASRLRATAGGGQDISARRRTNWNDTGPCTEMETAKRFSEFVGHGLTHFEKLPQDDDVDIRAKSGDVQSPRNFRLLEAGGRVRTEIRGTTPCTCLFTGLHDAEHGHAAGILCQSPAMINGRGRMHGGDPARDDHERPAKGSDRSQYRPRSQGCRSLD
jgi:hypothetical protein